ncbi:hypothetical protein ScPMuIL_014007 [Solemya velum]
MTPRAFSVLIVVLLVTTSVWSMKMGNCDKKLRECSDRAEKIRGRKLQSAAKNRCSINFFHCVFKESGWLPARSD